MGKAGVNMNQYEKEFYRDIREKKIAATGAHHRASGNPKHGKKIMTPSDYLTAKQRKELSGPVTTVMLRPMNYTELKSYSDAEKKVYLKLLLDKFKVNRTMLANMLGVHISTVTRLLDNVGVSIPACSGSSKSRDKIYREFETWCNEKSEIPIKVSEEGSVVEKTVIDPAVVQSTPQFKRIIIDLVDFKITFER